jgi:AcrR family transcriptional regulator
MAALPRSRDVPARAHQLPHTRASRSDWVDAALAMLIGDGAAGVKVARLADRLGVRRSSFYWYFEGRDDLDAALLDVWESRNVGPIVEHASADAPTITAAVLQVFRCWADPSLFDSRLEFAVRGWAGLDERVRERLHIADERRVGALADMHRRHGDDETTATVRARVHYHAQIGMYALGVDESMDERLRLTPTYVAVFAGTPASPAELDSFSTWVRSLPAH